MQVCVSNWSLSILPGPIPELQHTPLPFYSVVSQGACLDSLFFCCFQFGTHIWVPQGVGNASPTLSKLKFNSKWIQWVSSVCWLTSSLVKVNGEVGEDFHVGWPQAWGRRVTLAQKELRPRLDFCGRHHPLPQKHTQQHDRSSGSPGTFLPHFRGSSKLGEVNGYMG